MEPVRVVMSVRSLVRVVLWAGVVLALAILLIVAQFGNDESDASVGSSSTTGCVT